jgi:hypothetical protein
MSGYDNGVSSGTGNLKNLPLANVMPSIQVMGGIIEHAPVGLINPGYGPISMSQQLNLDRSLDFSFRRLSSAKDLIRHFSEPS